MHECGSPDAESACQFPLRTRRRSPSGSTRDRLRSYPASAACASSWAASPSPTRRPRCACSRRATRRRSTSRPRISTPHVSSPPRGRSFCEWKGTAAYLDVVAGERREARAAWTYPEPVAAYAAPARPRRVLSEPDGRLLARRRARAVPGRRLLRRLDHRRAARAVQGRPRHVGLVATGRRSGGFAPKSGPVFFPAGGAGCAFSRIERPARAEPGGARARARAAGEGARRRAERPRRPRAADRGARHRQDRARARVRRVRRHARRGLGVGKLLGRRRRARLLAVGAGRAGRSPAAAT